MRAPDRVVVIGASAGGVPALTTFVSGLDADLPAAVLVVLHVPADRPSLLPRILERAGPLPAVHPEDREPLLAGRIYIGPPDHHLLIADGLVRVTRGPWENGYRPSIDALFRSAARWHTSRVVGIVMSGALNDGVAGLAAVEKFGGVPVVQDPADASVHEMPERCLEAVPAAKVLPVSEIALFVNEVVRSDPPPRFPSPEVAPEYPDLAAAQGTRPAVELTDAEPAALVCPDCGGSMFTVQDDAVLRFRCWVGHGWTAAALEQANGRALEEALWAAVRVLEEKQVVQQRLVSRAAARGRTSVVERIEAERAGQERLIHTLRDAIMDMSRMDMARMDMAHMDMARGEQQRDHDGVQLS
jgi:two-component system, chemotaxis family, protein-glutamate methylesterase/glutaminase